MNEQVRLVTPKQLQEGWLEYRPNEVPNLIHHQFSVISKTEEGNYVVLEPKISNAGSAGVRE